MDDPMTLDVEVEMDSDAFEEQVAAAKRDLVELRDACEQANDAIERLQERDPITLSVEPDVNLPDSLED